MEDYAGDRQDKLGRLDVDARLIVRPLSTAAYDLRGRAPLEKNVVPPG